MRFGYRTTNTHLGPPQTLMIENVLMHHFRDENSLLDLGYSLKILKKLVNFKEVSLARRVSVRMYLYLYVRR